VPVLSPSVAAAAIVVLGQRWSKAKGRSCQESSDSRELARSTRGRPSHKQTTMHMSWKRRKKSELSSTWYPSGRAGVAGSLQSQQLSWCSTCCFACFSTRPQAHLVVAIIKTLRSKCLRTTSSGGTN
jgi:hypothetical protein